MLSVRGKHIPQLALPALAAVLATILSVAPFANVAHVAHAAPPAFQGRIIDIYGEDHLPALLDEFRNAKKSITISIYMIRLYPDSPEESPTLAILRELVAAARRGVKVTVILNNEIRFHKSGEPVKAPHRRNIAEEMLENGGVNVRHATPARILHKKLIVIDGDTVITGSHNFSDSALKRNLEHSVLLKSKGYAGITLKHIAATKLQPDAPDPAKPDAVVNVPLGFLTDKDLAPRMVRHDDERSFDLYLHILRRVARSGGRTDREIPIDHSEAAAAIGVDLTKGRTAWRRESIRTLEKLQDRYGLITCTYQRSGPATVRLTRRELFRTAPIPVPAGYWDYGWSRELGLLARSAYLICLAQEEESGERKWWTLSQEALAEKYPGNAVSIMNGMLELERHDLVEIVRSRIPPGKQYSRRRPNSYKLKALGLPGDAEESWEDLAERYGEDRLKTAQNIAGKFDKQNDVKVVADVLLIWDTYGLELTRKAADELGKMTPDNPRRHIGYMIGIIKKWVKEK